MLLKNNVNSTKQPNFLLIIRCFEKFSTFNQLPVGYITEVSASHRQSHGVTFLTV